MNTLIKIQKLCNQNNISLNKLEQTVGIARGSIAGWSHKIPSSENIAKVAKYFDVTTDYLLDLSNIPYAQNVETYDEDIISIQRARKNMSPKDRKRMMDIVRITFEEAFQKQARKEDDGNYHK